MSQLNGKIAVVTGGARGIGKEIVKKLEEAGAMVIVADKGIHADKPQTLHFTVDVTDRRAVEQFFQSVTNRFGSIDILVNNAGISTMAEVLEMEEEDWDSVMDVNAKGVFLASKYAARQMKIEGNGGKIINISSQAGKNGYRYMGSYVASKHAVLGLTKVMALELAVDNILVNAVCPGIIETEMKRTERIWGGKLRGVEAAAIEAEDHSQVPLGRTGSPKDVAEAVLFLASNAADYITGESINVTGGMTMN
ncbi:SDR family NAD(P)-dependent oxidoreductase [Sediminibacillus halophilus]|uniref:3-oxoacyl-[acyl-carrier protein] reductase n=1 Tax=Sediminibacillus halophilus TaxID=482461 RepID=A0A1G9NCK4_9BACI|nr:SDR family NAD(P)-dependent oxidoreductase [Sediminibacillus halophilus]SDL84164.1 3-oxoacyl-[acyl-carrier protein] reductase [Sediminibacillus halophilus]